jgi:hypothetical protein
VQTEIFCFDLEILIFAAIYQGHGPGVAPETQGGPARRGQKGAGPKLENKAGFMVTRRTEHDIVAGALPGCIGDVPAKPQVINIGQYPLK